MKAFSLLCAALSLCALTIDDVSSSLRRMYANDKIQNICARKNHVKAQIRSSPRPIRKNPEANKRGETKGTMATSTPGKQITNIQENSRDTFPILLNPRLQSS